MHAPELSFTRARQLRRDMSLPEILLWDCLRGGRLEGLRFCRQHPVGRYILDFYCPAPPDSPSKSMERTTIFQVKCTMTGGATLGSPDKTSGSCAWLLPTFWTIMRWRACWS